jgi:hypothetical protein
MNFFLVYSHMTESQAEVAPAHVFRIQFSFRNKSYTGSLTMSQKTDHDEYYIVPDEEALVKEFGSQTLSFYFNQQNPLRSAHPENEYIKSIMKGVQKFLDSKHS